MGLAWGGVQAVSDMQRSPIQVPDIVYLSSQTLADLAALNLHEESQQAQGLWPRAPPAVCNVLRPASELGQLLLQCLGGP